MVYLRRLIPVDNRLERCSYIDDIIKATKGKVGIILVEVLHGEILKYWNGENSESFTEKLEEPKLYHSFDVAFKSCDYLNFDTDKRFQSEKWSRWKPALWQHPRYEGPPIEVLMKRYSHLQIS